MPSVLQSLKDRAERILDDLKARKTDGLAAMDQLAVLAAEREVALKAAKGSGLSMRAFGIYWLLREHPAVKATSLDLMAFAKEAEALLSRFPNAAVNPDEQRRVRAALYKPLLGLGKEERTYIVEMALDVLLSGT